MLSSNDKALLDALCSEEKLFEPVVVGEQPPEMFGHSVVVDPGT